MPSLQDCLYQHLSDQFLSAVPTGLPSTWAGRLPRTKVLGYCHWSLRDEIAGMPHEPRMGVGARAEFNPGWPSAPPGRFENSPAFQRWGLVDGTGKESRRDDREEVVSKMWVKTSPLRERVARRAG